MKKNQQKIQVALVFTGLILIILTYFYYPSIKKSEIQKDQSLKIEKEENFSDERSTTF